MLLGENNINKEIDDIKSINEKEAYIIERYLYDMVQYQVQYYAFALIRL